MLAQFNDNRFHFWCRMEVKRQVLPYYSNMTLTQALEAFVLISMITQPNKDFGAGIFFYYFFFLRYVHLIYISRYYSLSPFVSKKMYKVKCLFHNLTENSNSR